MSYLVRKIDEYRPKIGQISFVFSTSFWQRCRRQYDVILISNCSLGIWWWQCFKWNECFNILVYTILNKLGPKSYFCGVLCFFLMNTPFSYKDISDILSLLWLWRPNINNILPFTCETTIDYNAMLQLPWLHNYSYSSMKNIQNI